MNNYPIAIIKALIKIYRHRRALFLAGRKLGVPTKRLWKHDNSKFHPIEFWQYVKRFELGILDEKKWARAWEHHWRHNDHHIEYWKDKFLTFTFGGWDVPNSPKCPGGGIRICRTCDNEQWQVWVPDHAIREMIADWMAASYAYSGSWPKAPNWKWGNENLVDQLMKMEHTTQPETTTRGFAVQLLEMHGMITQDQKNAVMGI